MAPSTISIRSISSKFIKVKSVLFAGSDLAKKPLAICFDEKNAGLKQKLNDKHSITVLSLKTHKNDLVRFDMLQDKITEQIREDFIKDAYVGFEGYSFGASGQITRIAEACAILKYKLYSMGCNEDLIILAPSTVKKFATGTGRADKHDMVNKFAEETGIDLFDVLDKNPNLKSIKAPITDIADSYWIAMMMKEKLSK